MVRLRTALVGCGKVGHTHARALATLDASEFVAVCDRTPEGASAFAVGYGVTPYTDLATMLRDERIDVLTVCTPHPRHADAIQTAASLGVHVLAEKPLAATLADCDRAIAACAAAGVQLGVVSQRRWYPPIARMRAAIDEGRIGKPVLASVDLLGWRDDAYYASNPWRGTWAGEGGGVLVNQAPHQLDLLQWLMGPVDEVFGYWGNLNHPGIEVDDTAVGVVRFRGGGLGVLTLSNGQRPGIGGRIHIHGSTGASIGTRTDSGSMFISGMTTAVEPAINDLWTIDGEAELLPGWQAQDRAAGAVHDPLTWYHERQVEDFLDAVVRSRPPAVDGAEGRKVVELFTALYRSQRDGGPVRFPLDAGADGADMDGRLGEPMRALLLTAPGILEVADVPEPHAGDDDVIVSVRAAGICGSDIHGMDGSSGRRVPPLVMGHEAAGVIERVGSSVRGYSPGDPVTFDSTVFCGMCPFCVDRLVNLCDRRHVLGVATGEYRRDGAFAERIAVPARILHRVPAGVSMVEAAVAEPLAVALHAVSRAPSAPSGTPLVIGVGVIGLLIVAALRAAGCERIVALDLSPSRLARATAMGATDVVPADAADVGDRLLAMTGGRGPDVVFEAVGIRATVALGIDVARKGGTVVLVGNVVPSAELPLQWTVSRELALLGTAASCGEFPDALGRIAAQRIDVGSLVSAVAPLSEGAAWFARLREPGTDLLKVVLVP